MSKGIDIVMVATPNQVDVYAGPGGSTTLEHIHTVQREAPPQETASPKVGYSKKYADNYDKIFN